MYSDTPQFRGTKHYFKRVILLTNTSKLKLVTSKRLDEEENIHSYRDT